MTSKKGKPRPKLNFLSDIEREALGDVLQHSEGDRSLLKCAAELADTLKNDLFNKSIEEMTDRDIVIKKARHEGAAKIVLDLQALINRLQAI